MTDKRDRRPEDGKGHIAIFATEFLPAIGGTSTMARLHALEFQRAGHHVTVVTRRIASERSSEMVGGIPVRRLGVPGRTPVAKLLHLMSCWVWLVLRRRSLVGVSAILEPDFAVMAWAAGLADRSIVTWATMGDASYFLAGPLGAFRRLATSRSHHVALTTSMANELAQLGVGSVEVIPVPAEPGAFRPPSQAERLAARHDLGLDPTCFAVLFVGHLQPRKGLDLLVEAMTHLLVDGHDVALLVVGGVLDASNRAFEQRVMRLAAGAPAPDRIRFFGPRRDIRRFLAGGDAFCLPSHREGMPNALIEAMACAVPCIAPASAGGEDLLSDGRGIVPRDNSSAELAAALRQLIEKPALAAELGRHGAERINACHDPSTIAAQYLELLRSRYVD